MWDSFFIDFTSCQLSEELYGVRKLEITRTETGKKKSGTNCALNQGLINFNKYSPGFSELVLKIAYIC